MALRFRRDVQKSSYYVWFLGAEESKGLRGAKIITSALPYLIDRSTIQEPLKVTLQVSHKGIKIIQGPAKHFIPHSAITYSIQIGDIVACILLLYNPETKCPLHVHAYRCDSETTAEALHQQLEVLINRPENQKQFAELERRIGLNRISSPHLVPEQKKFPFKSTQKKAESSLESTSTRDSECSGSFCAPLSSSPNDNKQKRHLFDSLAAELRAKLNGSGPPLLLPPRDYDTVHRSKGNIFRNKFKGNEKISGVVTVEKKSSSWNIAPEHVFEQIRSFENLRLKHSSSEEDLSSKDTANLKGLNKTNNLEFRKDLPIIPNNSNNHRDDKSFDLKLENILHQKKNEIEKFYSILNDNDSYQLQDPSYLEHLTRRKYMNQNCVPEKMLKGKNYTANSTDKQFDIQKKLNLTDKQKYLQMCENEKVLHRNGSRECYVSNLPEYGSNVPIDHDFYQQEITDTPYKQSENIIYKYRTQHNIRPVLRRNSFENDSEFKNLESNRLKYSNLDREMSAKDRFHGAKEKFRLIERSVNNRYNHTDKYLVQSPTKFESRNVYFDERGKLYKNELGKQANIIKNAKSLSNLSKGYRHSYAEILPVQIARANDDFRFSHRF